MHFKYKLLFILFFTFILFSCGSRYDDYQNVNNTITISKYLVKSNNFLLYLIFLLESGKGFWMNFYSRLYYFHFTLARVKSILQQKVLLSNNHHEIWALSKKLPRKIFREELKSIRIESDYNIIENEEDFIKSSNKIIIDTHNKAFFQQIHDIEIFCQNNKNIDCYIIQKYLKTIKNNYFLLQELMNKNMNK